MRSEYNEGLKVTLTPHLSDRLYTLAAEYSVDTNLLVHRAVKRLLNDVEFYRNLRIGNIKAE